MSTSISLIILIAWQALQSLTPLLRRNGDLTPDEIARVVSAARAAWSGRHFRVLGLAHTGGPEMEMLMAEDGRPRYVFQKKDELLLLENYTRRAARSCDGRPLSGELVIEYSSTNFGREWRADAYNLEAPDAFDPFYIMLDEMTSGPLETIDGHLARAFIGPGLQSSLPKPVAANQNQRLWIDVDTLLLVRWEITQEGTPLGYGYSFRYDPQVRIGPPAGVAAPECVKTTSARSHW